MNDLSATLKQNNHCLTESLLLTNLYYAAPMEEITNVILKLHGQPKDLFVYFFESELEQKKDIALVMRERSLSVCVLKHIIAPFAPLVSLSCQRLVQFGLSLSEKKSQFLMNYGSEEVEKMAPKYLRLKTKLHHAVEHVLCVDWVPDGLCILCHLCVESIRKNESVKRMDGTPLSHWAVGAVIFLRFLVPILTTWETPEDNPNRKGLTLMGRFLMKLCCKSEFLSSYALPSSSTSSSSSSSAPPPHPIASTTFSLSSANFGRSFSRNSSFYSVGISMINEVLKESFELYDNFCEEVIRKGKLKRASSVEIKLPELSDIEFWRIKSDFTDFVTFNPPVMLYSVQEKENDFKMNAACSMREFQLQIQEEKEQKLSSTA
uniref:Uncharacterized protein n=1 Tax=Paramoeba aestuarina TaxID=180227 RepID=A0A7S4NNP7_9EUKA|mmetsp:Transcript_22024/g.34225  ORF Transcript_22024/g.34225 Transcript_22024/m.34225 type:complete len:376 (+) Transcript_22024:3-1130(+)